ncbi:TetR/AcrR family transcriptional regulator [Nocardioides coralli]|uniref:TetR/AcrR family transcriptional regulator n=1 Tax=Nocardioides coralli TaxID=2872154 RepID=UPI001CA442FC|nr:TetR/AcrR family transcriptional regulator [Nocardioides coralli]QZY30311.1 TetR/AcrR family transcriptional regulator [Nocardioides coralli]
MTSTRPYRMSARAAAAAVTRERIAAAAEHAFSTEWYDDVTIRGIAHVAEVSEQTVLNHFSSKDELCAVAFERWTGAIDSRRAEARSAGVGPAVSLLVEDYELTGDTTLRMLAVEHRVDSIRPWLAQGRREHERWVASAFAGALEGLSSDERARRLAQLVVVTDVYAWKLLRRDRGLEPDEVAAIITDLVRGLHR